ncbi:MAG: hypothetical protein JO332_05055 [Planctomycetaceae bacterium]|nr:hypothetical protein [Planctomycetaceae bacterium]
MTRLGFLAPAAFLLLALDAAAIKDKDNQGRWDKRAESGPDREVPGFLVNLGPTGARAVLTEKTFVVRYLLKGAPGDGRLRPGDVLTGAFGKPFSSHTFGGEPHGYEGPILDLGDAIERAEAKDGRLVLNVLRGSESIEVAVPLEPIGAFSPTFPMQCRKSELLRSRALKYLAEHPESGQGPAHARAMVTLALLTSGDSQQEAAGKRMALSWNDPPGPGTWTWGVSYQLITLCEYHLLTGDAAVLPTIKAAALRLREDQYDGRILVWAPKPSEDPKAIDAAQQLYLGGFGHTPYSAGVGKNGYGPMQYTTILAVIAWQLAERCGVKAEPRGLRNALDFIHRGTNEAGYVAYGGEFTLNNGLIDPVAWRKSTGGTNYVGRAGASLLAHLLSPEFPDSAKFAEKNRGYLKKAYKSLPDGHACSVLGFAWGLLGAAASEDESVLRTMLDYHKAWFTMMRCPDGSFVVQPGRDYADEGYYISSRYNPTAVMALVLGLGYPKLLIQGTQVSIPGVNPKALRGSPLAAYKAVVAKSYGEAARLAKGAGPEAAAISAYLETQARRAIEPLRGLEAAGRWGLLRDRLADLRRSYGGIASFDDAAAAWEAGLRTRDGAAGLEADKLASDGFYGKAREALRPAAESPAGLAIEARIQAAARERLDLWAGLERAGRWHRLRKDLELQRDRFRGVTSVDAQAAVLEERLSSEAGRVLVEADRLFAEGFAGPAWTACQGLETDPGRALREEAAREAERLTGALQALEREGRWNTLREELSKARPKLVGAPAFDKGARAWDESLASPEGRAWVSADRMAGLGDLGAAARMLAAHPHAALQQRLESGSKELLAPIAALEAKGDWYALDRALAALRKKLSGVPGFDERDAALQAALRAEPARTALRLGAALARLREAAARRPSPPGLAREIEAFVQQAGDGPYAREARELLKGLPK